MERVDLSGAAFEELLRPAAELAIEMAQTGARLQPPLEVPSRLRPLLGHAKVTKAALATARRVVDDDADFRTRVAMAVEMDGAEHVLGRAGVLWLSRPEGWEAEMRTLVGEASAAAAERADGAEERSARRRLSHAEKARDRAEVAAETARRAVDGARVDLAEERRLRREAEDNADRMARRASSLEEQLAAARRGLAAAVGQAAESAEGQSVAAGALASAEAERRALQSEVADLHASLAEGAKTAIASRREVESEVESELDRRVLGDAVAAASAAAVALGTALGRAAAALEPVGAGDRHRRPPAEGVGPGPLGRPPTQPRSARSSPRPTGRRPAPLPPLVHDDSAEAAEYLVSLPGVTVLIDGYNATLSTWPGLPLSEQRVRLVDALAEMAARTGARPEVVFDGEEVAERAGARPVRSLVKVTFTAADVEADDVLIARAHDRALPVVVASDDRRVREGAIAAGANVLGIDQLLAALRRTG